MNYRAILNQVLFVYQKCDIKSFPINCYDILKTLNIQCKKYSELSEKKRIASFMISNESYYFNDIIYYNDDRIETRIRFSLMHELGHILLKHKTTQNENRNKEQEAEANFFSKNILAPPMAIYYARCEEPEDIAKIFNVLYICL